MLNRWCADALVGDVFKEWLITNSLMETVMSKSTTKKLELKEQFAILKWMQENEKELAEGYTYQKAIDKLFADTGILATTSPLARIAKAANIKICKSVNTERKVRSDGHSRDAILAKIIRRIADALGESFPHLKLTDKERADLTMLISRRTPEDESSRLTDNERVNLTMHKG